MIETGRCGRIRVTVVADDRTPEEVESDERKRLHKDRIGELPEGFSLLEKIRGGDIYFRHGDEVIMFDYEFSGDPKVTVLVMSHPPMRWIHVHTLQSRRAPIDDQSSTKAGLVDWLTGRGIRFSLDGKIQTVRKQRRIPRIAHRG
jgi:hypothetical protein